jgi:putative phosphoesterase
MKFIFISDIHANLTALEAVWQDIQQHKPDNIFCLGDLVNFAGWDNEVIDFIRSHNITTIQGNHDEGIGYHKSDFSFSYKNEAQKLFGYESIQMVNNSISEENRNFISCLPFMLKLEFHFPFHYIKMTMVHGSISSNNEYVKDNVSDEYLLEMMDTIDADILLMGHTHIPFHRAIFCEEENRKIYKHAINVGSVGKPKHGNNKSCYAILDIDENIRLDNPDSIKVNFEYVDYDVEQVIKKIRDSGLGHAYDDFLRNGQK